jgi:hypothetical protein
MNCGSGQVQSRPISSCVILPLVSSNSRILRSTSSMLSPPITIILMGLALANYKYLDSEKNNGA